MRKRLFIALTTVGAFLLLAGNALAAGSSGPREGSGGNNIVCNGVPSKAMLMYYAHGGTDSCGHHDIAAIWKSQGITPQVASLMHAGQVCSSQGLESTGRHHSPNPSLDRPVTVNGTSFYVRPLAVWGSSCYSAWVGTTEDGRLVAVLMGCGNSEVTEEVPTKPKTPMKPASRVGTLMVCKSVPGGAYASFRFRTTDLNTGKSRYFRLRPAQCQTLRYKIGDMIRIHENPAKGWVRMTDRKVRMNKYRRVVFVNHKITVKTTTTSTTSPCSVTINNSTVTGNITNCSSVTITVICGTLSQTFTGPNAQDAQEQAYSWQQANCTSSSPPPPPAQVCTDKNASNYGGALPCQYPPQKCTDTKASNYGGPLPCVYPPPVTLSIISWTNPEEITVGDTYPNVCMKVQGKSGDMITVTFSSIFGSFTQSSQTIKSSGVDQVCTTYIGPKDSSAVGKNEVITYNAVDTTAGVSAQPQSSLPFPVHGLSGNPTN